MGRGGGGAQGMLGGPQVMLEGGGGGRATGHVGGAYLYIYTQQLH